MPAPEFPRDRLGLLVQLGARLLDSRKPRSDNAPLARDLLVGFFDICMRSGLDRVLVELEQVAPPLDLTDRTALSDHPTFFPALLAQLGTIDLDGGGPRNAKPGQLADCVVAALGLTLSDAVEPAIELDDSVRVAARAALASVVDVELAVPKIRDTIIAEGRARCDERYQPAFDKIAAQLDERGMRVIKQPKLPLDAVQVVQRVLSETTHAVLDRIARTAIDRAKDVIARADAEAAARIDRPITHRFTPRDAAVLRAGDARVPKTPPAVVDSLLESLTELARLTWRERVREARPYGASQTFAVGDVIEHPKFGRGTVISCLPRRIEVEFADGRYTLVHAGTGK